MAPISGDDGHLERVEGPVPRVVLQRDAADLLVKCSSSSSMPSVAGWLKDADGLQSTAVRANNRCRSGIADRGHLQSNTALTSPSVNVKLPGLVAVHQGHRRRVWLRFVLRIGE